jgi:Fe-S cluster assembly protein SufD
MNARPREASFLTRLAPAIDTLPNGRVRAALLERLVTLGLPTPRDDAFKYTALRLLERRELAPLPAPSTTDLSRVPQAHGPRLVRINGRAGAITDATDSGATITTIALDPSSVTLSDAAADRLRLLNAMLATEETRIEVAKGAIATLEIVHLSTSGGAYPKLRIELAPGASLNLIETYLSASTDASVTTSVVDVSLARDARMEHVTRQLADTRAVVLEDCRVRVADGAHYGHASIALGAQLARLDLTVSLEGRGANADLRGIFLPDGNREHHLRTLVEHRAPDGTSTQTYRGVATGRGRGSYDGKVVVSVGAAGTSSRQSSRNLLLSPEASIETRPQLEINADAVKCSHGATTGSLDERMMFYLLSRGLDPETARAVLTYAFLGDVLTTLKDEELRRQVEERILGVLPSADVIRGFVHE